MISLVQIATSMQDNAFSTIPRLIAFLVGLLLLLPWMLQRIMAYTIGLFGRPGPLCPLTLTLSAGTLLRLSAGAGARRRRAGLRAAAGIRGAPRAGASRRWRWASRWRCRTLAGGRRRERDAPGRWPAGSRRRRRSGSPSGCRSAIVLEAFTLAAQVLGLQAGYAYASTIDPNTEADSACCWCSRN